MSSAAESRRERNSFIGWRRNRRTRSLVTAGLASTALLVTLVGGSAIGGDSFATNLDLRNVPPSFGHPFGTDWLGRDMFARTMKGLSLSIVVGLIGTVGSVSISLLVGLAAATMGRTADRIVTWLIDLFLSVPHLVSLILISFALGGGFKGVAVGIALTHWPSLARVVRAEVMQLRSAEYVQVSRRLGKSRGWVAVHHMVPHLIPQILVGVLILFPHAVLHEAAVTFVGLGLSPHQPAIGIILSESMRYLSTGMWWLAFFPGLCLFLIVRAFDAIGENLRTLVDPHRARR
ncbi:ABC transporter permease [Paenibacillus sp.]|uniref:ABC transporter permease n=1 Tax=Paenibacillus sp. TaxID=58172 RepID=UPI00281126F8|nr:ABC transporter permease [Paenibacillus sp.]